MFSLSVMDPDVVNAIGGQVVAIIGSVVTLIGAVTAAVVAIRAKVQLNKIHETVNGNLSAQVARTEQVTAIATEAGLTIPELPQEGGNPHG